MNGCPKVGSSSNDRAVAEVQLNEWLPWEVAPTRVELHRRAQQHSVSDADGTAVEEHAVEVAVEIGAEVDVVAAECTARRSEGERQ
jgi:hypothetical protein